jgi:hypothetical protein
VNKSILSAFVRSTLGENQGGYWNSVMATLRVLLAGGPVAFADLLRQCLNCDPAVLHAALQELLAEGMLREFELAQGGIGFGLAPGACDKVCEGLRRPNEITLKPRRPQTLSCVRAIHQSLPEATPLFSQWWFTAQTYEPLLRIFAELPGDSGATAFLGSPTLGAVYSQTLSSRVTVLDIDKTVLDALSSHFSPGVAAIPYDACQPPDASFVESFGLVVADPPWGRGMLDLFLYRAAQFTRVGGAVVISFPPRLTRPGLEGEIRRLLMRAKSYGLAIERTLPGLTEYVVPEFERGAYRALGLELTEPWRRGDVLVFRKMSRASQSDCPVVEPLSAWHEFAIGRQRVFLRRGVNGIGCTPSIQPVPGALGFVCPTTSGRTGVLQRASLVTTRNRVAMVDGAAELSKRLPQVTKELVGQVNSQAVRAHCARAGLPELCNLIVDNT